VIEQPNPCCNPLLLLKVSKSSLRLPDPSSTSSVSYQALYPNPSPHQQKPARQPCCPPAAAPPELLFEEGEAEIRRHPCPAIPLQDLPSQPAWADSKAEAQAHQETEPVSAEGAEPRDEADPTGKAEQPQLDQAVPVDPEDSRADEDPAQAETVDAVPQVREREQNRAEAGLLEEEVEARHPDPAEEPTSGAQQAPASEQDLSTGLLADREEPISRLEMESEMPAEASEPDQQDRRSLAIQARVSGQQGPA